MSHPVPAAEAGLHLLRDGHRGHATSQPPHLACVEVFSASTLLGPTVLTVLPTEHTENTEERQGWSQKGAEDEFPADNAENFSAPFAAAVATLSLFRGQTPSYGRPRSSAWNSAISS